MSDRDLPDVHIRLARREDVPTIVQLLADDPLGATREIVSDPVAQVYWDAFDAMVDQTGNDLVVAEAGGEVIGCLQLTIIPGLSRAGMKRALIEGVRVSSRHCGQKIGELLVRASIDRARDAGGGLVQLTTDKTRTDAQRFYERLGFEASHIGMKLTLR